MPFPGMAVTLKNIFLVHTFTPGAKQSPMCNVAKIIIWQDTSIPGNGY